MPSFDRFAKVTIGQRGEKGFLFAGFRVVFDITKSNEPTPNSGSVSLYNLADYTRGKIRNIGDALELEAGYVQDEYGDRLVITADVVDIVTEQAGPDIITVVRIGDGVEYLKTIKGSYSFKEGASVKDIIAKIAGAEGITLKSLDGVDDANYANGFAEMGPFGDILNKLVGKIGAKWSFQNNELQIIPKLGSNGSAIFKISAKTGMVGAPTRDVDTSNLTPAPQSSGWKVAVLLKPEIGPGDRVEIESETTDANGLYHVKEVKHSGDTHQGDFTSTLRLRESTDA